MAFSTTAWRLTRELCKITARSTRARLSTRAPGDRTESRTSPPETITPLLTTLLTARPDPVAVVVHELGRRLRGHLGHDRPPVVVQVEQRMHRAQVHVRVEIGIDRPELPPVAPVARAGPGDLVLPEVVDVRGAVARQPRDDVAAHAVPAVIVGRVLLQRLDQHVGGRTRRCPWTRAPRPAGQRGPAGRRAFPGTPRCGGRPAAACTTPKSVACARGIGIAATVTPAPQARCWSIICAGSIRYT